MNRAPAEQPPPVTLQISLAPSDLPHAPAVLRHQLRVLAPQVAEVMLTLDVRPAPGRSRFAEGWDERRPAMEELLERCAAEHPHARVQHVDYGEEPRRAVADRFFDGRPVPEKDSRGGPFYTYFFALHAARHDAVLHLDSDMLIGGGSPDWVAEGHAVLGARSDVLAVNPLGGPPTADPADQRDPPEPLDVPAFRASSISTRVFLVDRRRLTAGGAMPLRPPSAWRSRLKARLHGNPPYALPEDLLTEMMRERGMVRIDLLGSEPGLWTVHPPYRSDRFYAELPELIRRVESGDVPDAQRGDFDLNDSMIDWTDARAAFNRRRFTR